ncbi:MAG: 3-oxoacyl-[acyl-carrier-protein] reductase [Planctomycetes bacterium]|nr:3-oxoacyl-[acyl-carrier-protein] reductase [Planctomycetota bacterium]
MDLNLEGRIAVVTGASRGIGRAIALELAREGCNVACVATSAERAEETAQMARDLGVKAKAYGADVSRFDSAQELAASILADHAGGIDILVNNAGVTRDQLILRMSEADWDQVIDVNLKGAFNTSKAFAKTLMKRKGNARIINIASVIGLDGNAGQSNYAASKGGLIAFTKSLAKEFGSRQVCVNAVAPGFIETDMTHGFEGEQREAMRAVIPLGRFGAAEEVGRMVAFLAGDTGSYLTGQTFVIDGGMAI